MASFVYYLGFFLYLHVCSATARIVLESATQAHDHLQPSNKALETSSTTMALDRGSSIVQLDNHKFFSIEDKKIKTSVSRKMLSQGTGPEKWKKAEENISSKDEEVEVMDYAQPHRKPPIHNKGT